MTRTGKFNIMTTEHTFELFLKLDDLSTYNPATIRSWKHRLKKGVLREKKMVEILLNNDYKIKNKISWEAKYGL